MARDAGRIWPVIAWIALLAQLPEAQQARPKTPAPLETPNVLLCDEVWAATKGDSGNARAALLARPGLSVAILSEMASETGQMHPVHGPGLPDLLLDLGTAGANGSNEAFALMARIAAGRTRFGAADFVNRLLQDPRSADERLATHAEFAAALAGLAEDAEPGLAARLAAAARGYGWLEQSGRVAELLAGLDSDAEQTFSAFRADLLAADQRGEPRSRWEPVLGTMPAVLLHEPALPVESPGIAALSAPGVGLLRSRSAVRLDEDGAELHSLALGNLGGRFQRALLLRDAKPGLLVAMTARSGRPGAMEPRRVLAVENTGRPAWMFGGSQHGYAEDIAIAWGDSGAEGLLIAGKPRLRALRTDGSERWRREGDPSVSVASHPALPGLALLAVPGVGVELEDDAGTLVTRYRQAGNTTPASRSGDFLIPESVLLIPDANGQAVCVATGLGRDLEPTLVRFDAGQRELRSTLLTARAISLAAWERPGQPTVLAVATADGTVTLLDENLATLERSALLGIGAPRTLALVRLAVVALGDKQGLVVTTKRDVRLWRLPQ